MIPFGDQSSKKVSHPNSTHILLQSEVDTTREKYNK